MTKLELKLRVSITQAELRRLAADVVSMYPRTAEMLQRAATLLNLVRAL